MDSRPPPTPLTGKEDGSLDGRKIGRAVLMKIRI
jgi:hypothetical protein